MQEDLTWNVRLSTVANLKAEFHKQLTRPGEVVIQGHFKPDFGLGGLGTYGLGGLGAFPCLPCLPAY